MVTDEPRAAAASPRLHAALARSFAAGVVGPPLGDALFAIARPLPFIFDALILCSMTMISLLLVGAALALLLVHDALLIGVCFERWGSTTRS